MSAAYPNVPVTAGVPAVLRGLANPGTGTEQRLTHDAPDIGQLANLQWGIFKGGASAIEADNVSAVSYRGEYRIADYPIEEGGFESYDKVTLPKEVTVRLTKGGTLSDRQAFMDTLGAMKGDREIYDVVTPEVTFLSVNISHVTIDRSAENGAGMIVADIGLSEIRQNATAKFSKTKEVASADKASNGAAQTKPAPAAPGAVK